MMSIYNDRGDIRGGGEGSLELISQTIFLAIIQIQLTFRSALTQNPT